MIPLFKVLMSDNAIKRSTEVLSSGFIGQGKVVDEFESKLSETFNFRNPVTVNSGTTALTLALRLLKKAYNYTYADGYYSANYTWNGLNDGDEVLTTPLTCTATNWSILAEGLNIKWVDVDTETLNMSLEDLKTKITEKTKVLMLVHWGGYPNDLDAIDEILDEAEKKYGFKIKVIEDCAHALGSRYKFKYIGNHNNLCAFSLQAIKHLTSVDGGILIPTTTDLNARARLLRWYGIDRDTERTDFRCEGNISEYGFKWHMNDVNAGIGIENIPGAIMSIKTSQLNSKFYDKTLLDIPGVINLKREAQFDSSCWLHTIRVENRDDFMRKMADSGITVSRVHERNDKHTCVSKYAVELPNLETVVKDMVCIPNGFWVTGDDRNYIAEKIKSGW